MKFINFSNSRILGPEWSVGLSRTDRTRRIFSLRCNDPSSNLDYIHVRKMCHPFSVTIHHCVHHLVLFVSAKIYCKSR